MNYRIFVGLDISKSWFDAFFLRKETPRQGVHKRFENSSAGFGLFEDWLRGLAKEGLGDALIMMEHTGVYTIPLCQFLAERAFNHTLVPGLAVRGSVSMRRGGSDKVDSERIAKYALKNRDELVICTLPEKLIAELKRLITFRDLLVKQKGGIEVSFKEHEDFNKLVDNQEIKSAAAAMEEAFEKQISLIEKSMKKLIDSDESLRRNYKLIMSVIGIGEITAAALLVYTNNFISFTNSRKFATYCGVAPFGDDSGKDVGSKRVSHLANKRMKTLLSSCAQSAVQWDPELKLYFERQAAKGKNKWSVINVVKNKLLHRVFAVVRKGEMFSKRHTWHTI